MYERIQCMRWALEQVKTYCAKFRLTHDKEGKSSLIARADALLASLDETSDIESADAAIGKLVQDVQAQIPYLLAGFHGGVVFPADDFGYCEFDSPQHAADELIKIVDLYIQNKCPLNLEMVASALESVIHSRPDLKSRLQKGLKEGLIEFINPMHSQPFGAIINGESNVRHFQEGIRSFKKAVGISVDTMVCSEFSLHPQMPQILAGMGIRRASLRVRLNGLCSGTPFPVAEWSGPDGSRIKMLSPQPGQYGGQTYGAVFYQELVHLSFLARMGPGHSDVVYDSLEDLTFGLRDCTAQAVYASRYGGLFGRHMTYKQYLDAREPALTLSPHPDEFFMVPAQPAGQHEVFEHMKLLENRLLSAQCFYAAAGDRSQTGALHKAWMSLLYSQNHDSMVVPFCLSRHFVSSTSKSDPRFREFGANGPTAGQRSVLEMKSGEARIGRGVAFLTGPSVEKPDGALFNPCGCKRSISVYDKRWMRYEAEALSWFKPAGKPANAVKMTIERGCIRIGKDLTVLSGLKIRPVKKNRTGASAVTVMHFVGQGIAGTVESTADRVDVCLRTELPSLDAQFAFPATDVWVNFPFGMAQTTRRSIHALDFLWLKGQAVVVHSGTFYWDLNTGKISTKLAEPGDYKFSVLLTKTDKPSEVWNLAQQATWPIVQCDQRRMTTAPHWKGDGLVLSGFYSEKGRTILRLLNCSSNRVDGQVMMGGKKCSLEKLNGKKMAEIKPGAKVSFRAWEFKTFSW